MKEEIYQAILALSQDSPLRIFIEDELRFYKSYFSEFTSRVIREKKILEFENPNRMRVVYEFDVDKLSKTSSPLFVFLPETRKNWMKVTWGNRRLAISSSESVRGVVFKIVEKEIEKLIAVNGFVGHPRKLWEEVIWPGSDHIPCFVDGSFVSEKIANGQLVIEYYDSIEVFNQISNKCYLFDERRYYYDYALETGNSHWIYVKAPEKFQVEMSTDDERVVEIKGNDPEIKAFRIIPRGEKNKVRFAIDVKVPQTLRWWYGLIVYLGIAFIPIFLIVSIVLTAKGRSLTPAFAQVGISLVAAIIASRGWMMNDETVLKRASIIMTWVACIILVSLLIMYSVSALLVA